MEQLIRAADVQGLHVEAVGDEQVQESVHVVVARDHRIRRAGAIGDRKPDGTRRTAGIRVWP